ncbi:MAG: hypothetical protein IPO91_05820 [Chloroflexi bacterium]|nr:hypothetical protein [Chloroflexota bacterium]
MRGLLLLAVLLSAALTVIGVGVVQLGSGQALPPIVNELDACGLPCWWNITPRSTELNEALDILIAQGYHEFMHDTRYRFIVYDPADLTNCRVNMNYSGRTVTLLALTLCPGVTLGDVIAFLGEPEGILTSGTALAFRGGHVIVNARMTICDPWFAPELPVQSLYFLNAGAAQRRVMATFTLNDAAQAFAWRGFASEAYYQRVEAGFPVCK